MQINVLENGPILVTAVVDGEEKKVALCRCGKTNSELSMCDGTHRKIDFKAPSLAIVEDSQKCECTKKEGCCVNKDD